MAVAQVREPDASAQRMTGIARVIVPTPGTPFPECEAIYVGVSGNLVVRLAADPLVDRTFVGLAAGVAHPIKAVQVQAGTTATSILIGYTR